MNRLLSSSIIAATLMFAASTAAVALRPTHRLADARSKVDLGVLIPPNIGDWQIDGSIVPVLPSPDVQAKLDKIYSQTLARTYVNKKGERIMLSVAYGSNQSGLLQVHLPEVCYAAQGFQIKTATLGQITTPYGVLPVKRMVAQAGNRTELISYWITVGDEVVNTGYKRRIVQIKYGITGSVPDGILVRVSSLDRDQERAYALHDRFLRDVFLSISPEARQRIAGVVGRYSSDED